MGLRRGIGHGILSLGSAPPPPGAQIPIELLVYSSNHGTGSSGLQTFTGGIPLTPGAMTENQTNRLRLFINDVEQPIAVNPLRGRHPNESLRSIGVQVRFNATLDTPITGYVTIDPTGRQTSDLAWSEPDYASMLRRAVIYATDPNYLCATYAAFTPLQPEALDDPAIADMYGTSPGQELREWFDDISTVDIGKPIAQSTYDHIGGLYAAYMRSGNRMFYKMANDRLIDMMQGTNNPSTNGYWLPGPNNASYAKITAVDPGLTPLSASNSGIGPEWHSNSKWSWAIGYLFSAWKQPWRKVAHLSSLGCGSATTQAAAIDRFIYMGQYGHRFNAHKWEWEIVAHCIDATMQVPGAYGPGRNPSRSWAQELPWILDALEARQWPAGDYRSGLVGASTLITECTHPTKVQGHFQLFQLFITARGIAAYHQNVEPDQRPLDWIVIMADFLIPQFYQNTQGEWISTYEHRVPPVAPSGGQDYFIPFFPHIFGAAYSITGDTTYKTWCQRAMARSQLSQFNSNKALKQTGEYMNHTMQSAPFYYSGGAMRGIAGAHPNSIRESIAYTS